MANHQSTKKSVRQTIVRNARNKSRVSEMRTITKQLEAMVEKKDYQSAKDLLSVAQSKLMRNVKKGLVKFNAASRKTSRLAAKVKSIATV